MHKSDIAVLLVLTCTSINACATSETDPERKKPGGFADAAGNDSSQDVQSEAEADSSADAAPDTSTGDASADVVEAAADAPPDADAAADAATAGSVVLVSRSASGLSLCARQGAGAYATQTLALSAADTPALAATASGALLVVRNPTLGELQWATWSKAGGNWSTPVAVNPSSASLGSPALASAASTTLAFLGTDFKFYVNRFTTTWQGTAPVLAGAIHSFGPTPPSVAVRAGEEALAFVGDDGKLYAQRSQAATFQPAQAITTSGAPDKNVTPSVVARDVSQNPYLVVYAAQGGALHFSVGNGATWSSAQSVGAGATSVGAPALAALESGGALLAYRGSDDRLHVAEWNGTSFSSPSSPFPSTPITAPPAAARSSAGRAEIAWTNGGTLLVTTLGTSGYSTPVSVIASGQQSVAVTYVP